MKRIRDIAITVWTVVLVSIVIHAAWAHHSVQMSAAYNTTSIPRIHALMLISEGRDALLAVAALLASVFMARSTHRAPAIILMVVAGLALLQWSTSFLAALQNADRTFFSLRPWTWTHSVLLWHGFLETGVRCLLALVGLACGIVGIGMNKRPPDAEQQGGGYSPPDARSSNPTP